MAPGASSGSIVVYGAIAANLLIALTKFGAAYLTGSASMVAEAIHSVIDAGNDSLLLLGMHMSRRPPDAEHPLGHGRDAYFWGLIVAILLFGIGGGLSVYEGYAHIKQGEMLTDPLPNYVVLACAAVFEGISFSIGIREINRSRRGNSLWHAVTTSKDPSIFVVVFEDAAAITGLAVAFAGIYLSHLFAYPRLDGFASMVIGAILAGVGVFLSYQARGLLIGESASSEMIREIVEEVNRDPSVEKVTKPYAIHLGPHEVALALDIHFNKGLSGTQLAHAIDRLEAAIQARQPDVKHIFIEADALGTEGEGPPFNPQSDRSTASEAGETPRKGAA